jgi:trimethylamine--corrinoid protein Co-methyltransferase
VKASLRMLDEAGAGDVHARTLDLLWRVGVKYSSPKALAVLREAGAPIDEETLVAHLPADLVERALELAPREVLLAARDPEWDARLGIGDTYTTLDGSGAYVLDHRTGERRSSTTADLAELARLCDALDEVSVLWNAVVANDAAPNVQTLVETATLLEHTAKHVQAEVQRPEEVPFVMELLAAANADGRWHPDRPTYSVVYCPVAPLQHELEMVEACMELARQRVPMAVYTLGLCGATAPASLAGAVLQTNAEILSALVLFQVVEPGAPVIYVGDCGILDMHAGIYVCAGPEAILLNLALIDMAHHYGLPCTGTGFTSDAKEHSFMAGLDAGSTAMASMLAGVDLLTGMGMLDAAQLLSLPKLVLDTEIMRQCRRLARGIEFDEEHFLSDLIARVGPGGNYLTAKETRVLLRAGEHLRPLAFVRGTYDAWQQLGRSDVQRAAELVDETLASHRVRPLPAGAKERFDAIIAAGAAELPGR